MKGLIFCKSLIVVALLAGCKKLDVEPVDGTPVFFATAEVDGVSKNWQAGVDGYFMFTEFEKDPNDVHVFTGRLQRDSCNTGCGESLTIQIRDFEQVFQGSPDIGTALNAGDYFFKNEISDTSYWILDTTTFYRVDFDASPSFNPQGTAIFNWDFGGGNTSTGPSPIFDYNQLDQPVPVTLNMVNNNLGCSSSQTRAVQKQTANTPCAVQIFVDPDTVNSGFKLDAFAMGNPPFSYLWSNGSTTASVIVSAIQIPEASVTVTDANGCVSSSEVSFQNSPGTVPLYCSAAFDFTVTEVEKVDSALVFVPGDSLCFSKITVGYVDAAGRSFRSDLHQQPGFSYFKILTTEDFGPNENGEKTKKLTIRFACRMWDGQGGFIEIKNGEGVIAVAYP